MIMWMCRNAEATDMADVGELVRLIVEHRNPNIELHAILI